MMYIQEELYDQEMYMLKMGMLEIQRRKNNKDFNSCKECAAYFGRNNIHERVIGTDLCLVDVDENWNEETVRAIDLLKKSRIKYTLYVNSISLHLEQMNNMTQEIYDAICILRDQHFTAIRYFAVKLACKWLVDA